MIQFISAIGLKLFGLIVAIGIFYALGLFDSGQSRRVLRREKKKEDDAETKWLKWREKRDEELKAKKQKDNSGSEC